MSSTQFTFWHKAAAAVVVSVIIAAGYSGFRWLEQVTLQEVVITGAVNVTEAEVLRIIRVEEGEVMYDISQVLLEDRLVRHPWIQSASVSRLPSGLLRIEIVERIPVAILIDADGRGTYFADRVGHRMPKTPRTSYDLPLISGNMEAYHPMRRIEKKSTLELLAALPGLPRETDALISEFVWIKSGWELRLTGSGNHASIPVWLGEDDFALKFKKLQAFWDHEVLPHQNKRFELIDLRFDGQAVVTEHLR